MAAVPFAAEHKWDDSYPIRVPRLARGNHRALTDLNRHFSPALRRLALGILHSRQCAHDVVSDVFREVWENAHNFDSRRASVSAWLRFMTRSRARDSLRRTADPARWATGPRDAATPDFGHHDTLLHSALSTLSPLRQQLLRLAFFDGLSQDEIAETSGLAPGTVKSHVRRALLAMRSVARQGECAASRIRLPAPP